MSHGPKTTVAIAALLLTAPAPASAAIQEHDAYFLINGPDYREVSAGEFEHMRGSCLRIERKAYPVDHVVEWHCYL